MHTFISLPLFPRRLWGDSFFFVPSLVSFFSSKFFPPGQIVVDTVACCSNIQRAIDFNVSSLKKLQTERIHWVYIVCLAGIGLFGWIAPKKEVMLTQCSPSVCKLDPQILILKLFSNVEAALQSPKKVFVCGCVKFINGPLQHFCLARPGSCLLCKLLFRALYII